MSDFDETNRGALFKADKQGNEKRPDYTGPFNFNGQGGRLAAWIKKSNSGQTFMSLSWEPVEQKEAESKEQGGPVDLDDSIPFAPEFR